jgi:RimJ/RimL family protein N-acetyltransferase
LKRIIKPFCREDLEPFIVLIDDKMQSFFKAYDEPFPTDKPFLGYFCSSDELFAVALKLKGLLIGYISLKKVDDKSTLNLGLCIHSSHQCKGYATEASRAMLAYARTALGLKHLISGTARQNLPSARVLERLGLVVAAEQ